MKELLKIILEKTSYKEFIEYTAAFVALIMLGVIGLISFITLYLMA